MIKRILYSIATILGLAGMAIAQPIAPGGAGGPTVSPYLNLLRNNPGVNNNAAFNYLTITRPQMALQQQANQLNQNLMQTNLQLQQQNQMGGAMITGGDTLQPVTGHPTFFGNYAGYFNNIGGGGMAGGGGMMRAGFGGGMGGGGQIGQGFAPGQRTGGGAPGAAGGGMRGGIGMPGVGGMGGGLRR